jgi:hypothetical protein
VPLTTYAELQTAIGTFLNRSDLTASVPDFIRLAEAQIDREVRHWRMETRTDLTFDEGFEDVPADWVETIRLQIDDDRIEQVSADDLANWREANKTAGMPRYYAHIAGKFEVYPRPDQSYSARLLYRQKIPALSDSNASNWLLDEAPDVYLYGSLIHSAPYLVEDQRVNVWASLYAGAVTNLNRSSDRARFSGPLTMRMRQYG